MLRALAIWLIGLYQRYLSPYKGYRCAHAAYHHGPSCSAAVKEIVREHGVLAGMPLVRLRFAQCRAAYQSLSSQREREEEEKKRQRRRQRRQGCCAGDDYEDSDWCLILEAGDCVVGDCGDVGDLGCGDCSGGLD